MKNQVRGTQTSSIPSSEMKPTPELNAAPSCKDCCVGRGYVELCPLHAAAPALYQALGALYGVAVPSINRTAASYRYTKKQALEMARTALTLAYEGHAPALLAACRLALERLLRLGAEDEAETLGLDPACEAIRAALALVEDTK